MLCNSFTHLISLDCQSNLEMKNISKHFHIMQDYHPLLFIAFFYRIDHLQHSSEVTCSLHELYFSPSVRIRVEISIYVTQKSQISRLVPST